MPTDSRTAGVGCAEIAVVAVEECELTEVVGTGLGGAGEVVVAVADVVTTIEDRGPRLATPVLADIAGRADVIIAAGAGVIGMLTPGGREAGVIGADVVVVAAQGGAHATVGLADVIGGARIVVVTGWTGDGAVEAGRFPVGVVASPCGTGVAIVADELPPTLTTAALALVLQGARVVIVAREGVVGVHAARGGIA